VSALGLCSAKGSPGVTYLATALASAGRAAGAVLVEADVAGGDLALAYASPQSPGLAQLAARARRTINGPDPELLGDLVRDLAPGGPRAVTAPVGPRAAETAVALLAAHPDVLASAVESGPVIVDCGRVSGPSCAVWPLLASCDVVCLVVRGDVVSLGHAAVLAEVLRETSCLAVFALVDTGPYRAREAAAVLGLPSVGTVPYPARRGSRALRKAACALHAELVGVARKDIDSRADIQSDAEAREAVSTR
jgi:hypothetical protein